MTDNFPTASAIKLWSAKPCRLSFARTCNAWSRGSLQTDYPDFICRPRCSRHLGREPSEFFR